MNGSTTRARTGRGVADTRWAQRPDVWPVTSARGGADRSAYAGEPMIDGANALTIAIAEDAHFAEIIEAREYGSLPDGDARRRRAPVDRSARRRVAPPLPVAVPRAPFLVLVLVIVVAGVLGVLMINTKINENVFVIDKLQQTQTALDLQEQQLSQDLAELESPGNLAAAAKRLGLVPAGTPAFIRLPDGKTLGFPQPASGTPSITAAGQAG